jgi:hypothetical protein
MTTGATPIAKANNLSFVTKSEDHSDDGIGPDLNESRNEEEDSSDRSEPNLKGNFKPDDKRDDAVTLQLPSPSASISQGQWKAANVKAYQSPPWPRRSPLSGRTSMQEEESSFNLLAHHSFDSLSENYLRDIHYRALEQSPTLHRRPLSHNCDIIVSSGSTESISPLKDNLEPLPFQDPPEWMLNPLPMPTARRTQPPSSPYFVLGSCRQAFEGCTFQLPYLDDSRLCPVNLSQNGNFQLYKSHCNKEFGNYDPDQLVVAQRRVKAAICAFGGNSVARPFSMNDREVIFRSRDAEWHPASLYEQQLHRRYFMNGHRISWEVEENPPIHLGNCDWDQSRPRAIGKENTPLGRDTPITANVIPEATSKERGLSGSSPTLAEIASSTGTEPPKTKYRCKLCGQPKMSHVCPYRQSVQRNIGIQVYPTANPFAANEPGALAPTLTDMNNAIIHDSDSIDGDDSLPLSPFEHERALEPAATDTKVTSFETRKRSQDEMNYDCVPIALPSGPFAEVVEVRPEQYRSITPVTSKGNYQYPPVALTFNERKKLSDTLFVMTQNIHQLSLDCANLLRDARERGMWDLAVAELLTQVVVAMYCYEGDKCLHGLQEYLLHLGIAC